MAQFNMNGKGGKGKKSLEKTPVYRALRGKLIFNVDQRKIISSCQSVKNDLIGQNMSFPVDIKFTANCLPWQFYHLVRWFCINPVLVVDA